MTQNPYQQGPPVNQPWTQNPQPQGYPQQGPPTGPPQGYPTQPPQQASPFTQPGQAGPPPPAGGGDPFENPGPPVGGGDAPGMHQLGGRLLLIRPLTIEKNAPGYQGGRPGDLVRADLIVCDGPPIEGNLNAVTEQFTPFAAGPKVVPFFVGSMYVRGAVLPGQLEPFIAGRGQCLGRLVKGQPGKEGKPPWLLADPTEQDKVIGRQIHAQWDQIKMSGQAPRPDQFGGPQAQQPYQPPAGQQGPPPGYPAQNPYGAPPQQYPGY